MTNAERLSNKLIVLKLLFTLWVVYLHAANGTIYSIDHTALYIFEHMTQHLFDIAVPSFFIMSGYLFYRNYTPEKLPQKMKSRFWSLLVPYVLWNTLYWLIRLGLELSPIGEKLNQSQTSPTFRSWLFDGMLGVFPLDGPLWFLKNLIAVVAAAPILYYVLRSRASAALLAAAVAAELYFNHGNLTVWIDAILFCFGGYLAIHCRAFMEERRWGGRPKLLAAAAILTVTVWGDYLLIYDNGGVYVFAFSALFLAMWILADGIMPGAKAQRLILVQFWVYCAHDLPLEAAEKIWLWAAGDHVWAAWIDYLVFPIIVILALIPTGFALRKYCPPVWRLLTGARDK